MGITFFSELFLKFILFDHVIRLGWHWGVFESNKAVESDHNARMVECVIRISFYWTLEIDNFALFWMCHFALFWPLYTNLQYINSWWI